jgi:hypothetical protein
MPASHDPARDDELIRYLLGDLPEDVAERFDELSVVDDEFVARLRVVEDDLLDAYVGGRLTGDRLKRFEALYLSSPRRRDKATFARRFLAAVDPKGPRVDTTDVPARIRVLRRWFPWALAAAAALCLAIGSLILRDARLHENLREADRRVRAADEHLAAVSDQLAAERRVNAAGQVSLAHARAAQPGPTVALVLMPQTRGVGPVPIIAISQDATVIAVALAIEGAPRARYEASLKDPTRSVVVWRSAALPAEDGPPARLVTVSLPASLLKAQHYAVDLFAVSAGHARNFVDSYAFEVVRR